MLNVYGICNAYSNWPEVRLMTTITVSKTLNILQKWFVVQVFLSI